MMNHIGSVRQAAYGSKWARVRGQLLDYSAYLNQVEIDFSRPERPGDKTLIEAFNCRLCQECLNASGLLFMAAARPGFKE